MFLECLKQPSVKALFLELSALIMMAEDNKKNTSYKIKNLNIDEQIQSFWQNIGDNELDLLLKNSREMNVNCYTGFNNSSNMYNNIPEKIFSKCGDFYLINILINQTESVLEECHNLEHFRQEVIQEISLKDGGSRIISRKKIKDLMLKNKNVRQDILIRTIDGIFANREINSNILDSKEKKAFLYELIQSGYINGQFDDNKKILLLRVCNLINIDSEYLEELLEITGSLFVINKNLTNLINE